MDTKAYIKNSCYVVIFSGGFDCKEMQLQLRLCFKHASTLNIPRLMIDFAGVEDEMQESDKAVITEKVLELFLSDFYLMSKKLHLALVNQDEVIDYEQLAAMVGYGLHWFYYNDRDRALRRLSLQASI